MGTDITAFIEKKEISSVDQKKHTIDSLKLIQSIMMLYENSRIVFLFDS